jgi:hypothetical protein
MGIRFHVPMLSILFTRRAGEGHQKSEFLNPELKVVVKGKVYPLWISYERDII